MQPLLAVGFDSLFGPHMLILLIIGILLFGKRLPEVGRSLGKGIVEFKKGLKGLEDDVSDTSSSQSDHRNQIEPPRPPQKIQTTAPKFEAEPSKPTPPPQA